MFSDVDSAYAMLNSNLALLRPYKTTYLAQAARVRDYRSIELNYLNLVGSYLTAASQLNLAVGREVLQ